MKRTAIPSMLLCLHLMMWAQQAHNNKTTGQSEAPIDNLKLTFSVDDKVQSLPASPVLALPLQCSSDGTGFVEMIKPPRFRDRLVESISPDGGQHVFETNQIVDLYGIQQRAYYPSDSIVVFLVNATRDNRDTKHTVVFQSGEKEEKVSKLGERHDFISIFDRDGNYKKSLQLDDSFTALRVAVFRSGQFLILGYDRGNRIAELALLDTDGSIVRLLDFPSEFALDSQSIVKSYGSNVAGGPSGPISVLSSAQLISFNDDVLVVQPGSLNPILQVSPSGAIRRILLKFPHNSILDHFVPSDTSWYVAFRSRSTTDKSTAETTQPAHRESALYEVNPLDGSLVRRIDTGEVQTSAIACVHNGVFMAYARSKNGNLSLLTSKP